MQIKLIKILTKTHWKNKHLNQSKAKQEIKRLTSDKVNLKMKGIK